MSEQDNQRWQEIEQLVQKAGEMHSDMPFLPTTEMVCHGEYVIARLSTQPPHVLAEMVWRAMWTAHQKTKVANE